MVNYLDIANVLLENKDIKRINNIYDQLKKLFKPGGIIEHLDNIVTFFNYADSYINESTEFNRNEVSTSFDTLNNNIKLDPNVNKYNIDDLCILIYYLITLQNKINPLNEYYPSDGNLIDQGQLKKTKLSSDINEAINENLINVKNIINSLITNNKDKTFHIIGGRNRNRSKSKLRKKSKSKSKRTKSRSKSKKTKSKRK